MANEEAKATSVTPSDQIEQRKQENPHNIYEVPVQACNLYGIAMPVGKRPASRHDDQSGHNANAHDHVKRMKASEREIKEHEEFDVVCVRAGISEVDARRSAIEVLMAPLKTKLNRQ